MLITNRSGQGVGVCWPLPSRKVPNILDTAAIVTLQARSRQVLLCGSRTPGGVQHRGWGAMEWWDGQTWEGGRQRSPRIQEHTYRLCWRLDNSRATYMLSFGARTGRDKGTKWDSGLPGRDNGRGLRVWKVSGQGGAGLLMHSSFGWALGWDPERGQADDRWSGPGTVTRQQRATRGYPGSDQCVVELATLERLLVVGPGRGRHAAVGVE